MKVYQALAQAFESDEGRVYDIMKGAPSGPGIDSTSFIPGECTREQLVFYVEYQHIDEYGGYDARTYHRVIVTPDLLGINLRVTGRNKNDIRKHLSNLYYQWLTGEYID